MKLEDTLKDSNYRLWQMKGGRTDMMITAIELPMEKIVEFCDRKVIDEGTIGGISLKARSTSAKLYGQASLYQSNQQFWWR